MLELSLSRMGLGPVAASPWLLLLLIGASWLLARILAWTFTFYNNSRRLRCFLQPPKLNWFLGHMDLVPPTEQGLINFTQMAASYPHGYLIWFGPIIPMVVFCHPDMLRSITNASAMKVYVWCMIWAAIFVTSTSLMGRFLVRILWLSHF